MRCLAIIAMCIAGTSMAMADILVPNRTIRPNTLLSASDFVVHPSDVAGAIRDVRALDGMEARVALYPGRPIRAGDIGPPAIVERNEMVTLTFSSGGLQIVADGRALARGAAGDRVRVMNLASRATLIGTVQENGSVRVNP